VSGLPARAGLVSWPRTSPRIACWPGTGGEPRRRRRWLTLIADDREPADAALRPLAALALDESSDLDGNEHDLGLHLLPEALGRLPTDMAERRL
jgi:hypothetical protein